MWWFWAIYLTPLPPYNTKGPLNDGGEATSINIIASKRIVTRKPLIRFGPYTTNNIW